MEKKQLKISNKLKTIFVIVFIVIYAFITYISLRGQYLEYLELGEQYVQAFFTNIKYKYTIMGISFVLISIVIYLTNRGIKKGLKPFFEQEGKEMPKLPNKSITLAIAAIVSVILSNNLLEKVLLFSSNVSFEKADIIFNMDISYYMFIKPLIVALADFLVKFIIGISIYMTGYYILVFNICFEAVDRTLLRNSKLIKNLLRNVFLLAVGIAILTILGIQDIVLGNFLTLSNGIELTGAGFIESTIRLWGYLILSLIIVIVVGLSIRYFKKNQNKKIMFTLSIIPIYLIVLFIAMVGFDLLFIKPNEFDKEKQYIGNNIEATKNAYNIKAGEENVQYTGTIKEKEVQENLNVINNIPLVSKDLVIKSFEDTQTESGHYNLRNVQLAKYNINGKEQLVYLSPREIENQTISYNNKTYEYTHGIGQVVASATQISENGNIQYIQKDIEGKDNIYKISEPRIYYGLETKSTIVTNTKNKTEYDYTDEYGNEHIYNYSGKSGIQVGFFDRLILAIKNQDIKLAFSRTVSNESKILTNRNIIQRAKTALPFLMYDENPYTVVSEGHIYWVLDGYTISNQYPYSTYTEIEYNQQKQKINYIRNSVKVIINAYDGEMTFYITDRTDPIIMAYLKLYPTIFSDYTGKEIPKDIEEQLKYPELLYNIQSKMLMIYHNVKEDVLYRNSDIWSFAEYGATSSKTKMATLKPYYTMIKTPDSKEVQFGLVQMYTPNGKSNINAYLVGTCDGLENKLKIYKYPSDSNILGPAQLDNQIEQDETISTELSALNTTGSRISKDMKVIPIDDTILYVETVYQTMTNELNTPTIIKKVIVASGTKVAMGNNLTEAMTNLLSQSAVNIKINNTEDVDGMIKAIIDANNNLKDSSNRNDWEMMGADIQNLQTLIDSLEKIMKEQDENSKEPTNDENNKNNETYNSENVIN
ncbi:MAG: UPF0182 family protein [Clostridia bacterium]|nr:UPF0182 family protein [Clostridia bacterium]